MADRSNKYQGKCAGCGTNVAAEAGFLADKVNGKWTVECRACRTGEMGTPAHPDVPLAERPSFPLTDEQVHAVELYKTGESLALEAGAGTGKTSTLVAIAKSTSRPLAYVAFNRDIVTEASAKMPANVACSTMSKLAFHQVGKVHYSRKLPRPGQRAPRTSSSQYASLIGLRPFHFTTEGETRTLQPAKLAGMVRRAIETFCKSGDTEPTTAHIEYVNGIDQPTADGRHGYEVNDRVRAHLAPLLGWVWADYVNPEGTLPGFNLKHVEKIWQLGIHGRPSIPGDGILFDEAQDANPVYLDVVRQQAKQVVYVGDSQQQIYAWNGAVNALGNVDASARAFLTNSFRFGPEIAAAANAVLDTIDGAEIRIVGRGQAGTVGATSNHDAVLCRTNAGAIRATLDLLDEGRKVHLNGQNDEVLRFAKGAQELIATGRTDHDDLSVFASWAMVQAYVEHDDDGADLKLLVKLVDDYGADRIIEAVSGSVSAQQADVIVSTCHKAKGLEWDTVKLGSDFTTCRSDEDRRLLYVAITRARKHLDPSTCPAAQDILGTGTPEEEA